MFPGVELLTASGIQSMLSTGENRWGRTISGALCRLRMVSRARRQMVWIPVSCRLSCRRVTVLPTLSQEQWVIHRYRRQKKLWGPKERNPTGHSHSSPGPGSTGFSRKKPQRRGPGQLRLLLEPFSWVILAFPWRAQYPCQRLTLWCSSAVERGRPGRGLGRQKHGHLCRPTAFLRKRNA